MEHTTFDLHDVQEMVMAAERVGVTPIVRTPGFDPAFILRLLDMGVQGVQVPHVSSAAVAREAVKVAAERDVILFDNAGVGSSTGETPSTVAAMTKDSVDFCRALDLKSFYIVGFSLGGMIAQQLAFEYPDMIRRMILLGTGPRGGEGMTFTELSVDDLADPEALLMSTFFTSSEASKAAGRAYIERLKLRVADRDAPICKKAAGAQLEALREWGTIPSTDRYAMLAWIRQRTLIVHGSKDIVVIPINAFLLAQHLPDAQLVMYPDASHGAQSQHAESFSSMHAHS
jgi:pimeloyl-ACP methyl ester carboxylesterase